MAVRCRRALLAAAERVAEAVSELSAVYGQDKVKVRGGVGEGGVGVRVGVMEARPIGDGRIETWSVKECAW